MGGWAYDLFKLFTQEPRAQADVHHQDQTTRIQSMVFVRELADVTLVSATVVDSNEVTLAAGHGFVGGAGEIIGIKEDEYQVHATVISVAVNTLTLDRTLDHVFTTSAEAHRESGDLAVDGSSTPVEFKVMAPPEARWDITQIRINMVDDTEMDDTKFGGVTDGLTYGLMLKSIQDGVTNILGVARTNGALKFICTGEYADKAGGGNYGFTTICRFNGNENAGVVIRLDGETDDELVIVVQDDLTDIDVITAVAHGHIVED